MHGHADKRQTLVGKMAAVRQDIIDVDNNNNNVIDLVNEEDENGVALNSDDEDDSNDEPTETSFTVTVPLSDLEKGILHKNRKAGLWKGIQWMVVFGRTDDCVGFYLGYHKPANSAPNLRPVHAVFRAHLLDRAGKKIMKSCRSDEQVFKPPNNGYSSEADYDFGGGNRFDHHGAFRAGRTIETTTPGFPHPAGKGTRCHWSRPERPEPAWIMVLPPAPWPLGQAC